MPYLQRKKKTEEIIEHLSKCMFQSMHLFFSSVNIGFKETLLLSAFVLRNIKQTLSQESHGEITP